ncbi:MAG: hypothetical protein ACI85O_003519 [Saprospiraceae bacterium]|jgi:hypothetical protein
MRKGLLYKITSLFFILKKYIKSVYISEVFRQILFYQQNEKANEKQ